VGADPVITLMPSLAEALGAPGDFVGALASAFGAGASIGFVLLGPTRRRLGLGPTATLGLAVLAGAWLATALAPSANVTLAVLTVGGAGMTLALPTLTAIVQRATPDDVRGRVMALWSIAFLGSRPLTASVTGALADLTSVRVALATTAAVIAVGAVVTRQPLPSEPAPSAAPPTDASAATTSASVV
jgi:MFS family permease